MFDLGKLVFDLVSQLILSIVQDGLKSSTLSFFERRKIERRVEDATAEVVEGIVPFLEQEKVSQDKQQRLIETCISELKPLAENPTELFKGSLDGQIIFENLYHDKELPKVIIEDGLKDTYTLLFPRIATLLCKIPTAVKDWENEAWSENYRRFDDVVAQLKALFEQVDELASAPKKSADKTLNLFKRSLTQKVGLQLDITGLRADQPYSGKFDDFFILPEIKQSMKEKNKEPIAVIEPDDCFYTFTTMGSLNVVIGAPGAGKSTWSKWLQRETFRPDWTGIGIRVEFRDLKAEELPSIYDLVRKVAGKQLAEDLTPEKISNWLDASYIVFILDGFDEVRPTDRNNFVDWIKEISAFAKGCPFVITSRPLTTDHLEILGDEDKWKYWIIEPFDDERIVAYISKWYANSPLLADADREIDAEDLGLAWVHDRAIGPLTGNPLLLSTLLMVHHLDGKLPNGRANLYKRYIDGMLGYWDERYKRLATEIQINPSEKRKIIQGIALHLFLKGQETIDENVLIEWLDIFLPLLNISFSAVDVLLVLRERSGLLVGPGVYSFAHKTIAEYFVAETVLEGIQKDFNGKRIDRFYLLEHRDDDRWNVVIFLWAGIAPTIDVLSFVERSISDRHYSLAYGLLLDQYEKFLVETRKRIISGIKNLDGFVGGRGWLVPGWPNGNRYQYEIPTFRLRTLGDTKDHEGQVLETLIARAIKDCSVEWSDFNINEDEFGWLLFLLFSTIPSKAWGIVLRDYSTWIINRPAKIYGKKTNKRRSESVDHDLITIHDITESEWAYLVAGRVFGLWRMEKDLDLVDLYNTYISAIPQFSGFVSLILLSSIVELVGETGQQFQEYPKELSMKFLTGAFNIIMKDDIKRLDTKYLLKTKDWMLSTDAFSKNKNKKITKDLLIEFERSIETLFNHGYIEQKEQYKNVSDIITDLKVYRSQI